MRNDNRRAPQKHKASSVRRKRARRCNNAYRRSNGRRGRRSTGGSERGACEEEAQEEEREGPKDADNQATKQRGWRRVTAGALSYAQGGSRRQTARPTTQGTSKPYPFSGAQGASAPRKGRYVTQSNASTNGACPRTNACENVSNTIEQVRGHADTHR